MSSQRQKRAGIRAEYTNPINVTVIVDGIRKVIPYEEYERDHLGIKEEIADGDK